MDSKEPQPEDFNYMMRKHPNVRDFSIGGQLRYETISERHTRPKTDGQKNVLKPPITPLIIISYNPRGKRRRAKWADIKFVATNALKGTRKERRKRAREIVEMAGV